MKSERLKRVEEFFERWDDEKQWNSSWRSTFDGRISWEAFRGEHYIQSTRTI